MTRRRDMQTLDIFSDWEPPRVSVGFEPDDVRGGTLSSRIARAVSLALKRSNKSRDQIADEMSEYLGQKISKAILEAYASVAKEEHRISLERFMALIEVTGCHDLLGVVAGEFGYAVIPERFNDLIKLHIIEEREAELQAQKAALQSSWRRRR